MPLLIRVVASPRELLAWGRISSFHYQERHQQGRSAVSSFKISLGPPQVPLKFTTNDGYLLHGTLWRASKRRSLVIHVHGKCGNHFENSFLWDFAAEYGRRGIDFLTFSNRGCNVVTEAYHHGRLNYIGGALEDPTLCVLDIEAAVQAAVALEYTVVILQGHSFGCEKIIRYVIERSSSGPIVLIGPADSLDDLSRYREVTPPYYEPVVPQQRLAGHRSIEWCDPGHGTSRYGSHFGGNEYSIPTSRESFEALLSSGMLGTFDWQRPHDWSILNRVSHRTWRE